MNTFYHAILLQNAAGRKLPKTSAGRVKYKKFNAGSKIIGFETNGSQIPQGYLPVFETKDGYQIAFNEISIIGKLGEVPQAEKEQGLSESVKQNIWSRINGTNKADSARSKAKTIVNGALIGGGITLIYAMMKSQPKLKSAFFGMVLGGIVGNAFANYRK